MPLVDEINQMIRTILESSTWTSAGGANPVENFIKEIRGFTNPDLESMIQGQVPTSQAPADISKSISKLSKEDATGILSKAGISPQNTTNLLKMTGGQGILSGGLGTITRLLPPAAIVLIATQMIPVIIKELQRPGGFLDKRVKIDSRNEAFAVLDRQTRQNTRIGDRQVIIQQFEGFRNFDGYASTSTGELISQNADRVLDIGLFDRAQGINP